MKNLFFLLLVCLPCAAERIECPATADTWVSMHRWEGPKSDRKEALEAHGADAALVIQGRTAFALLQFDVSAARGLTVEKATLRIHRKPAPVPLHTVGLSTISGNGPWSEPTVNYFFPGPEKQAWSYPASDLVDVTFAQGGSLYSYERARDAGGDWWEVSVPPALVHALIGGDQYGLMLTDEKGQTQTRHEISSRESGNPPVLIVEGSRQDRTAPGAVRSFRTGAVIDSSPAAARKLSRSTLRPGSVVLHFGGAGDDVGQGVATGYEVRYSETPIDTASFDSASRAPRWMLDPLAPKPNPFATSNSLRDEVNAVVEQLKPGQVYYFAARAIDEAGNAGPVSALGSYRAYSPEFPKLPPGDETAEAASQPPAADAFSVWAVPETLKIDPRTGELIEKDDFAGHRSRNSVWSASSATVRLTGARNEFLGFHLAVESKQPLAGIEARVSKPLFAESRMPVVFKDTGAVQLYREWAVADQPKRGIREWYTDALVPLAGPFDLPSKDNPVPDQTVQPIFVDVYIPHDAKPGVHRGELLVRASGTERRVALQVEVLPLSLPDKLNFIVDLNCYSSVHSGYPVKRGTPEYRKLEQAYHRMAHLHRTNLDVLGYSHVGTTVIDHAPPLSGEGAATRVSDWSDWDAHFGPVLDGSAFSDLPRASVPVPALYLPFFENWPGDLRRSYKWDNPAVPRTQEEYQQIINRHALESGPIEQGFNQEYQDRYAAVVAEFARHFQHKGWTKTRYLVYFNNKYYYKRPLQGGRGISWWLLDEPNHRDDVLATNFLAYLTKKGLEKHPGVPIVLRTDISRIEWMRDLLSGQVDLNCISGRFFEKNRYLQDDRYRFGREYWNYASTNHPRQTNVSMRAWCWRVWLNGGDGQLPWNAVRGSEAWDRAEPLTVFYPGSKFGKMEPYASLRLKAYRRGQQDIEYLILLAAKHGWDRDAVTDAVAGALDLSTKVSMASEEDAGSISFGKVKDADMDRVRLRIVKALLAR